MNIVGLNDIKQWITQMTEKDTLPRFIVLYGPRGSGKKLISDYMAQTNSLQFVPCNCSVESVRNVIDCSYTVGNPTLYMFGDADKMSNASKNALLKVTEEPPQQAYFVITLEDLNNTLATIRSRATCINIGSYSLDELTEYATDVKKYDLYKTELFIMRSVCGTPGDVDLLVKQDIGKFYDYVENVVAHLSVSSVSNALKISTSFKYKDDDEGYDPVLFLRGVNSYLLDLLKRSVCSVQMKQAYRQAIQDTTKTVSELRISGINKQATIDLWLLRLRDILYVQSGDDSV